MSLGTNCLKILTFLYLMLLGAPKAGAVPDSHPSSPLSIERKEDEIILPPFLRDYEGGILNVISDHAVDRSRLRSAKPGEWLEYGDSFSTPDRMSVYVQMNEGLQWVGGGVFVGKIDGGDWNPSKPVYELSMDRGWMKVWVKSSPFLDSVEIKTPKADLTANNAVYWINVTPMKTEVYILSGSIREGEHTLLADQFYEWSGTPAKLEKTSNQWDFVSLEKRILDLYPNLIKLSHRANDEWFDNTSSKKYADLRSKGWKRADRFSPPAGTKK